MSKPTATFASRARATSCAAPYSSTIYPALGAGAGACRCYTSPRPGRWFSQVTRKPLARLHESHHRELDTVFFSRVAPSPSRISNKDSNERVFNKGFGGSEPGIIGGGGPDHKPPDERVLKLGQTLRKLSPLLPTILINPLPTDLLSPQITLHLFPSTHPHLPNVKGRVLYRAALWTVPVAWSSLPLLGDVKLQILSERMVRADSVLGCEHSADCGEERLVVRWRTEPRGDSNNNNTTTTTNNILSTSNNNHTQPSTTKSKSFSTLLGGDTPIFSPGKEGHFEGLFIFAFDEQGRIAGHTIEHADQANGWDRTSKFVTLTDWLLGKARETLTEQPALAAQAHHVYAHAQHYDRRTALALRKTSSSQHIGTGS
ncbi:hypothetical protein UA08_05872 [Talaromyces atroroseus]|uniref:Uncharacterized protein n=1 Tax=Talaromyces atroroseus TaxID=1441469 RepID=A0A225AIE4_TALAT|nr:hypothetical protein UA08_05872 [Talaromyces atroroseus]OKL59093.1 hypothetical protein UA08_05872 [Talaromyces atroroseus]